MRLTSRQLDLFITAYKLRSVRMAAASLHISQPAVSRAIIDLEAEVGTMLFDRSARRFEPTLASRTLFDAVQRYHSGLDRIARIATSMRTGGGHLRIAALPVLADDQVARAAGRLMARHEALRIDIEALGQRECFDALRSGRADVVIVSTVTPEAGWSTFQLRSLSPVLVVRSDDVLASRRKANLQRLGGRALVMLPPDSPFRQTLDLALSALSLRPLIRAEARTQSALVAMVREGAGVTIVDRALASRAGNGIVSLQIEPAMTWAVIAVCHAADEKNPAVQKFLDELRVPDSNVRS
jgi:DNA-binding transcriptional LysR family regulator